jgi:hypothetical protein
MWVTSSGFLRQFKWQSKKWAALKKIISFGHLVGWCGQIDNLPLLGRWASFIFFKCHQTLTGYQGGSSKLINHNSQNSKYPVPKYGYNCPIFIFLKIFERIVGLA